MTAPVFWVPLLFQEEVKLRTSNFVRTFIEQSEARKNTGSRGHSQRLPKYFTTLIHRAHRAVIFAIAQLSCIQLLGLLLLTVIRPTNAIHCLTVAVPCTVCFRVQTGKISRCQLA